MSKKKEVSIRDVMWRVNTDFYPSINSMHKNEIKAVQYAIASNMLSQAELRKLHTLGFRVD
jgi:hypothetical protein